MADPGHSKPVSEPIPTLHSQEETTRDTTEPLHYTTRLLSPVGACSLNRVLESTSRRHPETPVPIRASIHPRTGRQPETRPQCPLLASGQAEKWVFTGRMRPTGNSSPWLSMRTDQIRPPESHPAQCYHGYDACIFSRPRKSACATRQLGSTLHNYYYQHTASLHNGCITGNHLETGRNSREAFPLSSQPARAKAPLWNKAAGALERDEGSSESRRGMG